jgi:hypothetical protein
MKIKDKKTGKLVDVRLPKAFKEKWVKALRSGEYTQTTNGYLQDTIGYCCLGVACTLTKTQFEIRNRSLIREDEFGDILNDIKVPKLLKGSADTDNEDYNEIVAKLTFMNDDGRSFNTIATYIERFL